MSTRPTPVRPAPVMGAVAAAAALLMCTAAVAQVQQKVLPPKAQVWMDASTDAMAGMPDIPGMSALSGLASRFMRGAEHNYPTARFFGGVPGQKLDIAFYNSLKPGVAVDQAIPGGLGLGNSLPLLPPVIKPREREPESGTPQAPPEFDLTIYEYFGCGDTVRKGQPKVTRILLKDGSFSASGGTFSRGVFVRSRDIEYPLASHDYWPNKKNGKQPSNASLVGKHTITGDGVPPNFQFELTQNADFMPKIQLTTQGKLEDAIQVNWQPVDRATAYFLTAMGMREYDQNAHKATITFWSSAEVGGADATLVNFLAPAEVTKWLGQKVLLQPNVNSCSVPKGIFANDKPQQPQAGGSPVAGGFGMLQMIAYGPETQIAYPPRPTDPKVTWEPDWNARVRTKSVAMAMLGMDLTGMPGRSDAGDNPAPEQEPEKKENKLKTLKGLLGF